MMISRIRILIVVCATLLFYGNFAQTQKSENDALNLALNKNTESVKSKQLTDLPTINIAIEGNVEFANFPQRLKDNAKFQPLDKGFIDITKPPYNAVGDGVNDDSEAIQGALDDAFTCNLVAFFPANKIFLVSKQLKCVTKKESRKFAYQLIGSSKGTAPIIKLKDGSAVDRNILILFELITNGKSDPPIHYGATFRGINVDMGKNPDVSAISMDGAQHCVIEDVKISGTEFNAGICNLPGSGGGVVNLSISGGKIGILQPSYRPNPTIIGLTLENQSEYGIKITSSRGPVVVTGFKITSPLNPKKEYRAIFLSNTAFTDYNGIIDHGNANLCLTEGSIEVFGKSGKAIYNFAQDVTIKNVYVKAAEIIESGAANPPSKIVAGISSKWQFMSNYAFTSALDKGSVFVGGKALNNQIANFQLYDPLVKQNPSKHFFSKHTWAKLPEWDDSNILDIMKDCGATPENIDKTDDDGIAIQKAINQTTTAGNPNFGKTVFIPRGHFHIHKPLILKSGLKMIGASKFISVIQQGVQWKNELGALLESENSATGNLLLSDFEIFGFPNTTFLHIRTANTLVRDVVTENVWKPKSPSKEIVNPSEKPYVFFSDNAGGKVFHLSMDHLYSKGAKSKNYNLLQVSNTSQALTFYQLSIEHMYNSTQALFENAKHVTVFGFKYELSGELMNIINCDDIQLIGGSGNYQLENEADRAIIVIENSKNILIQNFDRKSVKEAFGRPLKEVGKYWIVNGEEKVTGDFSVVLYKTINR
jgi:hypothetical protein